MYRNFLLIYLLCFHSILSYLKLVIQYRLAFYQASTFLSTLISISIWYKCSKRRGGDDPVLPLRCSANGEIFYEHKVDMCPCSSDLWCVIVNMILVLGWACELPMVWVGLCNMSLGLWCAGVELEGGGQRWGEGQLETCRANGLGVVKDGREP
jgi:hypothetical protein